MAGVIILIAVFAAFIQFRNTRNASIRAGETLAAQAYASELLEYYISQSSDQLQAGLNLSASTKNLLLCSYNNTIDRTSGLKVNPVPMADLPIHNRLDLANTSAVRYVRFDVIQVATLTVRQDLCAVPLQNVYLSGRAQGARTIPLSGSETFKITVGVEWQTQSRSGGQLLRIEQSSTSQNL